MTSAIGGASPSLTTYQRRIDRNVPSLWVNRRRRRSSQRSCRGRLISDDQRLTDELGGTSAKQNARSLREKAAVRAKDDIVAETESRDHTVTFTAGWFGIEYVRRISSEKASFERIHNRSL